MFCLDSYLKINIHIFCTLELHLQKLQFKKIYIKHHLNVLHIVHSKAYNSKILNKTFLASLTVYLGRRILTLHHDSFDKKEISPIT